MGAGLNIANLATFV